MTDMRKLNQMKIKSAKYLSLLIASFCLAILLACSSQTTAQDVKPFVRKWQGMTYGSGVYDPMFTFTISSNGTWTDLTFGEAKAIKSKYSFDKKTQTITLFTSKGSKLYTFKLQPASKDQKERLIEQLPANETYRAMICYHKS